MPSFWSCVGAWLLILPMTAAAQTQSREPANQTLVAFEHSTRDYVLMHRRLERLIGPLEIGTPMAEINRIIQELAAAIRAERADAKQGDFFTPALARLLRARINETLIEHNFTVDDARASSRLDGVDYARVKLQVNGTFPWSLGAAMLPCVIAALPSLPPELQYRMVDDLLVLVDVHASLIVDILPYALIDFAVWNVPRPGGIR